MAAFRISSIGKARPQGLIDRRDQVKRDEQLKHVRGDVKLILVIMVIYVTTVYGPLQRDGG